MDFGGRFGYPQVLGAYPPAFINDFSLARA